MEESPMFSFDVYNIPLPDTDPRDVSKVSFPLSPLPVTEQDYGLNNSSSNTPQNSICKSEKNSNPSLYTSAVKINEQCYELPETQKQRLPTFDNKCYELPNTYFSDSVTDSHNGSILPHAKRSYDYLMSDSTSVIDKKKKSILKSIVHVPFNFEFKRTQGSIWLDRKDDDAVQNTFASPVYKLSNKPPLPNVTSLKRPHSDSYEHDCTPARKVEQSYERDRWHNSESYQKLPTFGRKSLPTEGYISNFSEETTDKVMGLIDRRKSFPMEKSPYSSPSTPTTKRSCTADQTPYAVDTFYQRKRARPALPYYNAFELITLKSKSGFIDSHCHLDFLFERQNYEGTYADYQKKHRDTFPQSYSGCLAVFCNPFTFEKDFMWRKYLEEENVWASFGCHPHNANDYNDEIEKSLCSALEHSKVRALGEIGLDYSNRNKCMKEVQFKVFRRQLKIALEKKLPVVIHCREAHEDGMAIMKEILPKDYTIHLHCFTDTWDWAQKWLGEFPNLFIGITNVVTFPSAESVHEVARNVPLTRLLLETDAPYFVPRMTIRGTRWSHPGMAIHVAAQIAALRTVPLEQILDYTRKNTKRMYNI